MRRWRRGLATALGLLGLAGCADLHLDQGRDDALVRVGTQSAIGPAAPHADLFLDYALLSDQTYADSLYEVPLRRPFDVGPDTYCDDRFSPPGKCQDRLGLTALARARLSRWQLVYARKDKAAFPCPASRTNCDRALEGLGVQVWMRRGRVCPEAVVAFRGTDGRSADDWRSNFRWFERVLPYYDQYDQVQDHVPDFIHAIESQPCYRPGRTAITAIGHSLGGGLAHQAAYQDGRIRAVVSYDPSAVTGFYDVPEPVRTENVKGLRIERVYELGEVLALPRIVQRRLNPQTACDPLIRTIRFHTVTGNPIDRHSLAAMTTGLLGWSRERHAAGLSASEPLPLGGSPRCRETPREMAAR